MDHPVETDRESRKVGKSEGERERECVCVGLLVSPMTSTVSRPSTTITAITSISIMAPGCLVTPLPSGSMLAADAGMWAERARD